MIPLLLLTSDRYEKTRVTIESLARHGYLDGEFMLLHADDASQDARVPALAAHYGFETVARSEKRAGQQTMRRRLIEAGANTGADWLLLWENDWEAARPFPWPLFNMISDMDDVWALRLFGHIREREGDGWPCATYDAGRGKEPADWGPLPGTPEPAEIGRIHWCTTAFVGRTGMLRKLAACDTAEDAMRKDLRGQRTVRTLINCGWHLGHGPEHSTPGNIRS
jgi:hypothetical protein